MSKKYSKINITLFISDDDREKIQEIGKLFEYTDEKALETMISTGWNSHFSHIYENAKLCYDNNYRKKKINEILEK